MPTDYIFLRAWNQIVGAHDEYNLDRARETHAPADSIFRRADGSWATLRDCTNEAALDQTIGLAAIHYGWDAVTALLRHH